MSHVGCFFLLWVMCMTMLACESNVQLVFPAVVGHPDAQCVIFHGFIGSCANRMLVGGEINCSNIECAYGRCGGDAETYCAMDIGPAVDGTHCGYNKVCSRESCINLPTYAVMPQEFGQNEHARKCEKPHSFKPSHPHSLHRRMR